MFRPERQMLVQRTCTRVATVRSHRIAELLDSSSCLPRCEAIMGITQRMIARRGARSSAVRRHGGPTLFSPVRAMAGSSTLPQCYDMFVLATAPPPLRRQRPAQRAGRDRSNEEGARPPGSLPGRELFASRRPTACSAPQLAGTIHFSSPTASLVPVTPSAALRWGRSRHHNMRACGRHPPPSEVVSCPCCARSTSSQSPDRRRTYITSSGRTRRADVPAAVVVRSAVPLTAAAGSGGAGDGSSSASCC